MAWIHSQTGETTKAVTKTISNQIVNYVAQLRENENPRTLRVYNGKNLADLYLLVSTDLHTAQTESDRILVKNGYK